MSVAKQLTESYVAQLMEQAKVSPDTKALFALYTSDEQGSTIPGFAEFLLPWLFDGLNAKMALEQDFKSIPKATKQSVLSGQHVEVPKIEAETMITSLRQLIESDRKRLKEVKDFAKKLRSNDGVDMTSIQGPIDETTKVLTGRITLCTTQARNIDTDLKKHSEGGKATEK